MPSPIRQSVSFRAPPRDVYEALMDSRKHARLTGGPARISRRKGGRWSVFGGGLQGRNVELVPGKKIVQTWRSSDWPEGAVSRVTFRLAPARGGSRLTLTHSGVPPRHRASIARGWREYYWGPMREMLEP